MSADFVLDGADTFVPIFFQWFIETLLETNEEANVKLFFRDVDFVRRFRFCLCQPLAR